MIGLGGIIDRFVPFGSPTPDAPIDLPLTALPDTLTPESAAAKRTPGANRMLAAPLPAAPAAPVIIRKRGRVGPGLAAGVSYDTALTEYKEIVSPNGVLDNAAVEAIIDRLDPVKYEPIKSRRWFLGLYDMLPRFEVVEEADEMINGELLRVIKKVKFLQRGVTYSTNDTSYVASGASGFISIGATKRVYKRIKIEARTVEELDDAVREAFSEAWIQIVLGNDPVYGSNVCHIWGMFRDFDKSALKRGAADAEIAEAIAAGRNPSLTIHIIMEPVQYTLKKFLKSRNGGAPVPIDAMIDQYKHLGRVLDRFQKIYRFYHRDLHQGNVMFDESDQIKLIDFGRCCINRIDGRVGTYRSTEYDGERSIAGHFESGFSYDLFMYLVSVIETHGNTVEPPGYEQPTKLLEINHEYELINLLSGRQAGKPDPVHLWDYVKSRTQKARALGRSDFYFHHTYPWDFAHWATDLDIPALESLRDNKRLQPPGFIAACKGIKADGGGARRTQRSKRMSRRTRKHRN